MFSRETFQKLAKISYFLFITSLFFPIRKVFLVNSAYQTGAYSDFTSFSLYLSDILLVTTLFLLFLPRGESLGRFYHVVRKPGILLIWLIFGLFWHFQSNISLNYYFLLKYAELIVAYGTTILIFQNRKLLPYFLWVIVSLSSFEAILALLQFLNQKSLGLKLLGENLIAPGILGVAKIVSSGTPYIRSYGTFPHPNLLAAFLCLGTLFSYYILSAAQKRHERIFSALALCLNLFGLVVTFSRAGYLSACVALGFMGIFLAYKKAASIKQASALLVFVAALAITIFFPWISTRATLTDSATIERTWYNKAGLEMVANQPVLGLGIGESVLHMEQYRHRALQPWEKQPVHNYFILAAAEMGLPGVIILIWLFWLHLQALLAKAKTETNIFPAALLSAGLIAFFVLMQFDHYFYTLQQTQMLLWVILGASASLSIHHESSPKI